MKRWHQEYELMYRRWRMELAKHSDGRSLHWLAPPSCATEIDCHCAGGIGTVRKRKPLDCGRVRCGICHSGKWGRKKRGAIKRAAIAFELEHAG